jgi:hypothetical protein
VNSDGATLQTAIDAIARTLSADEFTTYVVGVDQTGERNLIVGYHPRRMFARYDLTDETTREFAAIAISTHLFSRARLRPSDD